ncbi:methyltransferase domain-containing protein [Candidatus Saccharibacteria bacterium]|nr:methyltransferase domain-containing protein [Candidatus Saccharibacteria bacterium]
MRKNHSEVPVVLFVFSREKQLAEALECLKANNIPMLYVFADGPRNTADQPGVEKVRKLINDINWTTVKKVYAKNNMGLSESIQRGLNTVFKKYDKAIILEDDVCVAPGFFEYMKQALNRYAQDKRIAGVTGLRYPFDRRNMDSLNKDVFLAPRFSSWGWATWKDRWENLDFNRESLLQKTENKNPEVLLRGGSDLLVSYRAVQDGSLSGCWDFYYYLNMVINNQYFVWPKYNMVVNTDIAGGSHPSQEKPSWTLTWEKSDKKSFIMPKSLTINDNIIDDFLVFFDEFPTNQRVNMKSQLKKVFNKLGYKIERVPKESGSSKDPSEYTTTDGPIEVPCQKESYFYALNRFVKEGDKVLDVGMGIGYGMNLLSISAKEVYAVDVDEKAVDYCTKHVLGKNPKVKELKKYDGYHLPYKDNFFDVVTCVDVVEHVEDYDKFIDELLRVSKRVVFFATPNRRPEYTNPDGTPKNYWHLREWSFEELDKIVRSHTKKITWAFLDGPWEGPFKTVKTVGEDTLVLMPALVKKD